MTLLYLAGPYRSPLGIWGVKRNIEKAGAIARVLWSKGFAVLCPHLNTALMDGPDIRDEVFLVGDLIMLERCDGIVMISGWETSKGAKKELLTAMRLGLKIYKWNTTYEFTEELTAEDFAVVVDGEEV